MCTFPVSRDDETVRMELPAMPGLNPAEAQTAYWFLVFPNIALFLLPNHLFMLLFKPDGTNRTVESADLLVHPNALSASDSDRKIDETFAFWSMVNRQDIAAVERVQTGLESRAYPGGRMCYRFEEPVHRFQNMVIDRMVGRDRVPAGDPAEDPGWLTAMKAATPKSKPLVGGRRHKLADSPSA